MKPKIIVTLLCGMLVGAILTPFVTRSTQLAHETVRTLPATHVSVGSAFVPEMKITEWRMKPRLDLLSWCAELNCQTEATARYFLGDPDKKEKYAKGGRFELWIYSINEYCTLEVTMVQSAPNIGTVTRTSYSMRSRSPDGPVEREEWHFNPDSIRAEKVWRNVDAPPGASFRPQGKGEG